MLAKLSMKQWAIVSAYALLFGAAGCATSQPTPVNPSGYRIIPAPESRTAYLATARAFQWVDSDRLLFLANDRELSQHGKRGTRTVVKKAVATIHLWDIRAGIVRRYRDEPLANHLCVADGNVWYGLRRSSGDVVFEGPFGQERERAPTPTRISSDGKQAFPVLNRFTCKEYWFADLPRPNGGRSFPLREEDGVFERLGSDKNGNPRWEGSLPPFKRWIHDRGTSWEIDFPQETISVPLGYSPLLNAYLFQKFNNRLAPGVTNRIYALLAGSRSVRILDIPGTEYWHNLYELSIAQAGLIAKSSQPTKARGAVWDPGPAGVYLISGTSIDKFLERERTASSCRGSKCDVVVEQITSGLIDEMSGVSPDGCRVVVVVDPYDREKRRTRLEAIDLCLKGDKHVE